MKYRMPAVAGTFYSSDTNDLKAELVCLFDDASAANTGSNIVPKALIVPHAGYCYSGAIAASAFAYLKNLSNTIQSVILLGPSHQVALRGCAVPSHDFFTTPLGNIPVDKNGCQELLNQDLASLSDKAHLWEHALEVQLPFLQTCLSDFTLLPIVVGYCEPNVVSDILSTFAQRSGTVIVVSTDLSHYHSYREAQIIDDHSIDKIKKLAPTLKPEEACGCYALNGLLQFCRDQHLQMSLVKQANSGDSFSGSDKNKVVGYASFIVH